MAVRPAGPAATGSSGPPFGAAAGFGSYACRGPVGATGAEEEAPPKGLRPGSLRREVEPEERVEFTRKVDAGRDARARGPARDGADARLRPGRREGRAAGARGGSRSKTGPDRAEDGTRREDREGGEERRGLGQ